MKNPFVEQNNIGMWLAIGAGAIAAGTSAAYYLFKRNNLLPETATGTENHATDYLKNRLGRKKKHKSDIEELPAIAHHLE
jgi:hypothetical protein